MFSDNVLTALSASEEASSFLSDEVKEAIQYNKEVVAEYKRQCKESGDKPDKEALRGYELEQEQFSKKLDCLSDKVKVKEIFEGTFLQNFKEIFSEDTDRYKALEELYGKDSLVDRIAFDSILSDMVSLVKARTLQMVDQAFDEVSTLDKEYVN